jgi:hypothetical protein
MDRGALPNARWIEQLSALAQKRQRIFQPELLRPQSIHYGMLMRKFQLETFRREVPHGGYVVSVIRDFPKANMGLIEVNGIAKTLPEDWQFHRDRLLILSTPLDKRSFEFGSTELLTIQAIDAAGSQQTGRIELRLEESYTEQETTAARTLWTSVKEIAANQLDGKVDFSIQFPVADLRRQPRRLVLRASWLGGDPSDSNVPSNVFATNSWPIWLFPRIDQLSPVSIHSSASQIASELAIQAKRGDDPKAVLLTQRLDQPLLEQIERGAAVLMLPDGQPGSFPLQEHWFLRGSVVALPKAHEQWHLPLKLVDSSSATHEQNMLVELQHFDLASPVIPNIGNYLDSVDPMVVLWDNHDLRETRTHGLVFGMRVGAGRLLVSALNHRGQNNAAGRWLLHYWLELLSQTKTQADPASRALAAQLQAQLNRQQISLASQAWKFQPDPQHLGHDQSWFAANFDDSAWGTIRIDRHWEGQGFAELNKWAWYRTAIELPSPFKGQPLYLNLNGIDDYADIYVNGQLVDSVGNIAKKETAFEVRRSIDLSRFAESDRLQVAIGVYDWFGAGGIFRPITLSTHPLMDSPQILVSTD